MAKLVKIPYFSVNKYGQLTLAGETSVSIPDSVTPTWSSIAGKPLVFPPSDHLHVIEDIRGLERLNDTGLGSSIIGDPYTNRLKKLVGGGSLTLTSDDNSVTLTSSGAISGTCEVIFLNEETYSTVDVPYAGLTATSRIVVSLSESEDAAIQGLTVGVLSQTVGVGFSIWANAPDGATGTFSINYLLS